MRNANVSVYRNTHLVAILEADTFKAAWKAAIRYVRTMADADGYVTPAEWERPRGRFSYKVGVFRAVSTYRAPGS